MEQFYQENRSLSACFNPAGMAVESCPVRQASWGSTMSSKCAFPFPCIAIYSQWICVSITPEVLYPEKLSHVIKAMDSGPRHQKDLNSWAGMLESKYMKSSYTLAVAYFLNFSLLHKVFAALRQLIVRSPSPGNCSKNKLEGRRSTIYQ